MFLKKIVQISLFAFISSVSINTAFSGNTYISKQYQTEFTPVIPLPPVTNAAYSKICTGGVMIQEISLTIPSLFMGGGGGGNGGGNGNGQMPTQPGSGGMQNRIEYRVSFDATTRLAYNDPTGVNNNVCRTIPLNAKLVFLTTAIIKDGNPTRIDGSKSSAYGKAVSDVSTLSINGSTMFSTMSGMASICLKTSHLSNAAGVVLLKARKLCDMIILN